MLIGITEGNILHHNTENFLFTVCLYYRSSVLIFIFLYCDRDNYRQNYSSTSKRDSFFFFLYLNSFKFKFLWWLPVWCDLRCENLGVSLRVCVYWIRAKNERRNRERKMKVCVSGICEWAGAIWRWELLVVFFLSKLSKPLKVWAELAGLNDRRWWIIEGIILYTVLYPLLPLLLPLVEYYL